MESKLPKANWLYPAGPCLLNRGRSTFFSITFDGESLIYNATHNVVVYNLAEPSNSLIHTDHAGKGTCCQKSDIGTLVATADDVGNILVWDYTDMKSQPVFSENIGQGKKVNDIRISTDGSMYFFLSYKQ